MEALEILERLDDAGIVIGVAGGRLKLTPGSRVGPELRGVIRERKRDLVRTLLVLREAEAIVLNAEARYAEGEVNGLRCLAATLEARPQP